MQGKISTAIGFLLAVLFVLHEMTPFSYFVGKRCDVRFQSYLLANYVDLSKRDRTVSRDYDESLIGESNEWWAFRNILVVGRDKENRICFAGYDFVRPSSHQAPPLGSPKDPPLIVMPDGNTFCVRPIAVASIRRGYLGWSNGF